MAVPTQSAPDVDPVTDAAAPRDTGASSTTPAPWFRRRRVQLVAGAVVALGVLQVVLSGTDTFPESQRLGLAEPVNDVKSWVQRNRDDNVILANVLRPIGDGVLWLYDTVLDVLLQLPWFWLPLAVFLVILRSGRWGTAIAAALSLGYLEIAGLHDRGMETMSLMLICLVVCVLIGVPLGLWAGLNPRVERVLRPVLDGLQSLPVSIFLILAVMFFGIRQTPAAIATIAFAVPPMIRITAAGIRQVPPASVEAGLIFGSSRWQLLWKVQAPQAIPSLVTAVNQTIMLCLSMAVIGGLVGAGGLGGELIQTLRLRSPGRGFLIGLAIFAIAFAFDRMLRSLLQSSGPSAGARRSRWSPTVAPARAYWGGVVGLLVVGYVVGRSIDDGIVPWVFDSDIARPIDDAITWVRDEWGSALQSFSDFVVADIVIRLRDLLGTTIAWPVLILGVAALGWFLRGWKFAVFCLVGVYGIGALGMWEPGLTTLVQILVAVVVGTAIALPVGVAIGRRPRAKAVVEPVLDAMQTLPSLIYAIPFVMLFSLGFVPAMLATMFYAMPAGVRLAALAVEAVPEETLEAATTFGATPRQRMWGVQLPLALRGLALAANQVIMLSISMAIVAGMVGENGLGYQSVAALTKPDVGLGIEAGLSLLVMAIVLDRITEGIAIALDPARDASGGTH
jgi:glycine betaine/proline transport system permease protein